MSCVGKDAVNLVLSETVAIKIGTVLLKCNLAVYWDKNYKNIHIVLPTNITFGNLS